LVYSCLRRSCQRFEMNRVQFATYALLGFALAISVVTDLRRREIKDVVTYPTFILALLLRVANGAAERQDEGAAAALAGSWGSVFGGGVASGLVGALAGCGLFLVLHLTSQGRAFGLGDVKLMAVVGAGVGFPMILTCLVFVVIVGGLEAILVLLWQGTFLRTLGGMMRWAAAKAGSGGAGTGALQGGGVPYGVAIAIGTVWGVWYSTGASVGFSH
jgi:prepilin peptidase CpaA